MAKKARKAGNRRGRPGNNRGPLKVKQYGKDVRTEVSDINTGSRIYDDLGFNDPLDRMDAYDPQASAEMEAAARFAGDPMSEGYAGKRSADTQALVDRFMQNMDGFTAEENNALRMSAQQQLDRENAEASEAIMRLRPRAGQAAALMQKQRGDSAQAKAGMERDLLAKNIDWKAQMRRDAGEFVRGTENEEFGRGQAAQKNWQDTLGANRDYDMKVQGTNLDQQRTEKAAKAAGVFGLANYTQAGRNARAANRIAAQNASRSGGSGGSGGGDSTGLFDAIKNIYTNEGILKPEDQI